MKYWRISYYRTHNWIDAKYIKDEHAQGAINKAQVKNIVDVQEITEKDYKAGQRERRMRREERCRRQTSQ